MPWSLRVEEGPEQGRTVTLHPGQTVTVGRTNEASTQFGADSSMSTLHFAIGVVAGSLRFQNLSEANGTEVNGKRTEAAVLQPMDQIRAGQTLFGVIAPLASPYPAQIRIGGWGFEVVPQEWEPVEGLGCHFVNADSFKANISATEEPLQADQTLSSYVETQMELACGQISGLSLEGPLPMNVTGAEEALALRIVIAPQAELRVIQRQIYALSSGIVGVFTATVSESEPHQETLDGVIGGLSSYQG